MMMRGMITPSIGAITAIPSLPSLLATGAAFVLMINDINGIYQFNTNNLLIGSDKLLDAYLGFCKIKSQ